VVEPPPPRVFSRFTESALTYGWKGRLLCTLALFLLEALVYELCGSLGIIGVAATIPVLVIALRDVWRRSPTR
jgi:hypothetical protein